MEPTRFIIASIIKEPARSFHQQLVDSVSDKFSLPKINTPSHITLKDSFYATDTAEVERVIQDVADSENAKGNILIKEIGDFRGEIYYLDAKLDVNAFSTYAKVFNKLHELSWLQWDTYDVLDRNFHITITNKATSENSQAIADYLKDFKPDFELEFDNVVILKKLEAERQWVVHKEFCL